MRGYTKTEDNAALDRLAADVAQSAGHTPGPWEADTSTTTGHGGYAVRSTDRGDFPIANVYATYWPENDTNRSNETDRANARLIAAAPDLAEALRGLLEWAGASCSVDTRVTAARAALAKAGL